MILMLQDGEFGEQLKSVYLDHRRWEVILVALEPLDRELGARYGCRYLEGFGLPRSTGRAGGPGSQLPADNASADQPIISLTNAAIEHRTGAGMRSTPRPPSAPRPFEPSSAPAPRTTSRITVTEETLAVQERAALGHHGILVALHSQLTSDGWANIEEIPGAIDLRAVSPEGSRTLFEAKTLTDENEVEQCRAALAQLLEYRFFFGDPHDRLCLVVDRKPSEARLRLMKHLSIGVMVAADGKATTID